MLTRTIRHLLRIVLGYLAACAFSATAVFFLIYTTSGEAALPPSIPPSEFPLLLMIIGVGTIFAAMIALVPALILIVLSELRGLSGPLFFLIGGAVAGIVTLALPWLGSAPFAHAQPHGSLNLALMVVAAAGAGIVYWALAGRFAGSWRSK